MSCCCCLNDNAGERCKVKQDGCVFVRNTLIQGKFRKRQFAQWSSNECLRSGVISACPLYFSLWAGPASGFARALMAFPLMSCSELLVKLRAAYQCCPIRVITRLSTRPRDYGEAKWLVWGLNSTLRFFPGVPSLPSSLTMSWKFLTLSVGLKL